MKIKVKTVEYTIERRRSVLVKHGPAKPNICRNCGMPMNGLQIQDGNRSEASGSIEVEMKETPCQEKS